MVRTKKILSFLILSSFGTFTSLFLANCSGSGFEVADSCLNDGRDPFFSYSWHLANCGQSVFARTSGTAGVDLNLRATWSAGYTGNGIKVRISDDGLENVHEDLSGNFPLGTTRSRDYVTHASSPYDNATAIPRDGVDIHGNPAHDNHGTSVAGLIAAVGGNGVGSRGVAPKASLAVANLLSTNVAQNPAQLLDQATGTDFDILNMSWGSSQNAISAVDSSYETQLQYAVTNYRSNKGAILVKAAGNDFVVQCNGGATNSTCIGNSNFDGDNTNPYQIVVAAINATGVSSSYSSPGSNVWLSGFGGEFGYSAPAMFTTDRMGCTNGWSTSTVSTSVAFDKGAAPNTSCNYTATFNGTSSAAPTVSGAVALLLEANPNLTWRDVKYILAKTAVPMDYVTTGSIPHPLSLSVPTGYSWELPWKTNSAGFKFHNWYGFGKIDVDAAVSMAKSYVSPLGTYTEPGWINSGTINLAIGDGSLGGAAISQLSVSNGTANGVKIESVRIKLNITHTDVSQLAVELTSPSGMRSILVNMRNSLTNVSGFTNVVLLSNAFYQERSEGIWTLKVIDGVADGTSGTLNSWSINFTGAQ